MGGKGSNARNTPEAEHSHGSWTEQPRAVGWKPRQGWTESLSITLVSKKGFAMATGT